MCKWHNGILRAKITLIANTDHSVDEEMDKVTLIQRTVQFLAWYAAHAHEIIETDSIETIWRHNSFIAYGLFSVNVLSGLL